MSLMQFVLRFVTVASFLSPLKYISETYFSGESLLVIYWSNVSVEFRDVLMDYWMKSEIVTVETCNCEYVTDDINWERSFVKNTVVIFGDLVPERRHIESMRQCRSWNTRSKILVIVNDIEGIASITLNEIWSFTKAINVTTMVSTTSSAKYFTLYPYENFKIVELDKTGLFPFKPLDNLHGSVISVAAAQIEPYIMRPETSYNFTEGLELRILKSLSEKFNFQFQFLRPPAGESMWVSMSPENLKVVGDLGLVYRSEADLLFHGVCAEVVRCALSDITTIHTFDGIVWIVPDRPYTFNWRSILRLFQKELWALLWFTLILISITLYLITKFEFGSTKTSFNAFDAFFQIFAIHMTVPIHFYRKRQIYRLFIFTTSYYTMIIVALYQSSLITHLTTRGSEDQYKTIEEAIDDSLIGYFFIAARPFINISDHDLWNRILQPGKHIFSSNAYGFLRDMAENKTGFAFLSRQFANFFIHQNLLDENHEPRVRILPEDYNSYPVAFFTSKGHPLTSLIKKEILRLTEAGILTQWMKEILEEHLEVQEGGGSNGEDEGPKPLSIEHLKGAFYIVPLMCTVAGVIFICEIVYYVGTVKNKKIIKKESKRRNRMRKISKIIQKFSNVR